MQHVVNITDARIEVVLGFGARATIIAGPFHTVIDFDNTDKRRKVRNWPVLEVNTVHRPTNRGMADSYGQLLKLGDMPEVLWAVEDALAAESNGTPTKGQVKRIAPRPSLPSRWVVERSRMRPNEWKVRDLRGNVTPEHNLFHTKAEALRAAKRLEGGQGRGGMRR
jgi:hypothetical protein